MRSLILCIGLLVSLGTAAFGKTREQNIPKIHYDSVGMSWQGDSLRLNLRLHFEGRLPRGGVSLGVIPRLGGIDFPGIGYFRPSEARFYRRRQALGGTPAGEFSHLVLQNDTRVDTVDYTYSLVLPADFQDSVLNLETSLFTCGKRVTTGVEQLSLQPRPARCCDTVYVYENQHGNLPLPVSVVSLPLYEANVTLLKPAPETIKERTVTVIIRITYPVNRSEVLPEFEHNGRELARIDSILRPMAIDTVTYKMLKASIVGYASPEDTYEHNRQLSLRRATEMRDWLAARYLLPKESISVTGAGEDWDGLRKAVVESDMPYRSEVLAIMDNYTIRQGREKRLMDLRWGRVYNYMLEHFFPALRRMEFEMIYTVRAFTVPETDTLLECRPQDLSLEEIYDVARERNNDRTIQRRRDLYGREYDIAVRYFPDNVVANINASSAALVRGDLEKARMYLDRVSEETLAANNLGVYYWLCGDPDMAERYFRKAMESDPVRATYNLEELERWREAQQQKPEK